MQPARWHGIGNLTSLNFISQITSETTSLPGVGVMKPLLIDEFLYSLLFNIP